MALITSFYMGDSDVTCLMLFDQQSKDTQFITVSSGLDTSSVFESLDNANIDSYFW